MPMGAAKLISTGAAPSVEYGVALAPGNVEVIQPTNGSATSPTIQAIVSAGVGPFTYAWTINNAAINIVPESADTETVQVQAAGYNRELNGVLTCTVTDTGNADAETSGQASVFFQFGVPQ